MRSIVPPEIFTMPKRARRREFWALLGVTLALLVVVLAPFVVVVLGSFLNASLLGVSTEQWAAGSESFVTLKWFRYVFDLYGSSLFFSVKLALLSVLLCLFIGVPGGYVIARHRLDFLETLALLPLSLPGIALSIGLIQAFAIVRGAWWLILAGHLLYTLPFMVRLVTGALRSFDLARLEACAQTLGASFPQRFRLVVLPNLRHAMTVGSLLVFAVSWGEFNVSYLLNTPLHQTYPAALYATYTSNSFAVAGAATTIFLAVIIPLLLAMQWIGGDASANIEQGA